MIGKCSSALANKLIVAASTEVRDISVVERYVTKLQRLIHTGAEFAAEGMLGEFRLRDHGRPGFRSREFSMRAKKDDDDQSQGSDVAASRHDRSERGRA